MPSPDARHALTADDAPLSPSPESSPLWGLALVLAEIAERVERRRAEEHSQRAGSGYRR
jgi:hypothetical protein